MLYLYMFHVINLLFLKCSVNWLFSVVDRQAFHVINEMGFVKVMVMKFGLEGLMSLLLGCFLGDTNDIEYETRCTAGERHIFGTALCPVSPVDTSSRR